MRDALKASTGLTVSLLSLPPDAYVSHIFVCHIKMLFSYWCCKTLLCTDEKDCGNISLCCLCMRVCIFVESVFVASLTFFKIRQQIVWESTIVPPCCYVTYNMCDQWVKPKCIFIQSKALAPRFRLTQMAPLSSTMGTAACFIAKLGSAIVYTTLMVHHYSSWYK